MIFNPKEIETLNEILASKIEDWPNLMNQLSAGDLSRVEAGHICDALLAEFMSYGINSTYEPNYYGLQIEKLIDKINRPIAPKI